MRIRSASQAVSAVTLISSLTFAVVGSVCGAQVPKERSGSAERAAAYIARGNDSWRKGNWDRARADYDAALAFDPRSAVAYYNRGCARQARGDFQGALEDYNRAIEINPKHAASHSNRGSVYYSLGLPDEALEACNRAVEIDPDSAAAYNNRALARQSKRDLSGAVADFTKAIELTIRHKSAPPRSDRDDLNAAAIAIDTRLEVVYYNRGAVNFRTRDLNKAIDDFNRAIAIKPDFAMAYCNRGSVWVALGSFQRAIADFDRAIMIQPNMLQAFQNRGLALLLIGRDAEADKDFDRCYSLDSGSRPTIQRLINEVKQQIELRDRRL
jgi:tetratricopeptide (TPR) repeat protein